MAQQWDSLLTPDQRAAQQRLSTDFNGAVDSLVQAMMAEDVRQRSDVFLTAVGVLDAATQSSVLVQCVQVAQQAAPAVKP